MAEHVALPYPAEAIVAHETLLLDVISRVGEGSHEVCGKLPREVEPVDAQEWCNTCITDDMGDIGITNKHHQHPSRTVQ